MTWLLMELGEWGAIRTRRDVGPRCEVIGLLNGSLRIGRLTWIVSTGTFVDHFAGFAGGHVDPNTGLVSDYHRWYDPATGRWVNDDPKGFAGRDSNLVRYGFNDPIEDIDRLGLSPTPSYNPPFIPPPEFLPPIWWDLEFPPDDFPNPLLPEPPSPMPIEPPNISPPNIGPSPNGPNPPPIGIPVPSGSDLIMPIGPNGPVDPNDPSWWEPEDLPGIWSILQSGLPED